MISLQVTIYCLCFQVKEIFSFTQDDLTTEDVFILDCYTEIYVWLGSQSNVQPNLQTIQFGLVIILICIPVLLFFFLTVHVVFILIYEASLTIPPLKLIFLWRVQILLSEFANVVSFFKPLLLLCFKRPSWFLTSCSYFLPNCLHSLLV